MNDALLSSKKMDYCTPQDFFDKLNEEFHFVLDAAATEKSAKCNRFYTPKTDGLKMPWSVESGSVFCNPPYGRMIGLWVRKAYEESRSGTKIVLLIPARTDTSYSTIMCTEKLKSVFCAEDCVLRTITETGIHQRLFRLCWLYTTENIMLELNRCYNMDRTADLHPPEVTP